MNGGNRTKGQRRPGLIALGSLLERDGSLLTHGRDDRNQEILAFLETIGDALSDLPFRDLYVILGGAISAHEVEETVINVDLGLRVNRYPPSQITLKGSIQARIHYG